jgi:hypothetical protein
MTRADRPKQEKEINKRENNTYEDKTNKHIHYTSPNGSVDFDGLAPACRRDSGQQR